MESPSTTRKRTPPQTSSTPNIYDSSPNIKPSSKDTNMSINETSEYLPSSRQGRPMRSVSPPGGKTRLSTFIYILLLLTALLGSYYAYRVVQYKSSVGGWWSLLLGRKPASMEMQAGEFKYGMPEKGGNHEDTVESHIEALARALGMPTPELASAIAGAVRAYVPPASLSSIKAAEPTGEAVRVMLESEGEEKPEGHGHGVIEGMASGFESFVGMDEP